MPFGRIAPKAYTGRKNSERRPFFAECWAVDQVTMVTVFIPTSGIEEMAAQEMEDRLQEIGYFQYIRDYHYPACVRTATAPDGEEYFSINITVVTEDDQPYINGAMIFPWSALDDYNRGTAEEQC